MGCSCLHISIFMSYYTLNYLSLQHNVCTPMPELQYITVKALLVKPASHRDNTYSQACMCMCVHAGVCT